MMVYSITPKPAKESIPPTGSSGMRCSSRDSGTTRMLSTRHTAAIGTLIRNTACQSTYCTAQPPTKSPMGAPTPAMAAQMPIARGRSAFGKDVTTTERVAGITHAAPRPMSPRAAITSLVVTLSLNATQAEKDPITTNPTSKVERRPKRSPRAPIIRSDPPKTSA